MARKIISQMLGHCLIENKIIAGSLSKLRLSILCSLVVCHTSAALAELQSANTVISGDTPVTVNTFFAQPISGDLYLATVIEGQVRFIQAQGAALSLTPQALTKGSFNGLHKLLEIAPQAIAGGRYPLYQVVTASGQDPLQAQHWLTGLSRLNLYIKQPETVTNDYNHDGFPDDDLNRDGYHDSDLDFDGKPDACPGQTINTPAINAPYVCFNAANGESHYRNFGCALGGCHGDNPKLNSNGILRGVSLFEIRLAITRNKGVMGFLQDKNDAELQLIADYLQTQATGEIIWNW